MFFRLRLSQLDWLYYLIPWNFSFFNVFHNIIQYLHNLHFRITLLFYFHYLISFMTQIGSYYIHIPCREDVRDYDCWAKWPEDTITRTFILYLFLSQFFWSWKKLSISRVEVQIGAFETGVFKNTFWIIFILIKKLKSRLLGFRKKNWGKI